MIRTVLGDVAPSGLGFCDAHDHLLIRGGVGVLRNPDLAIDDVEAAVEEVTHYARLGGGAIVDAMPVDCGRDPAGLVEVSRRTGVHVVATTGFHTPYYYGDDHWSYVYDEDTITELLVAEVTDGLDAGSYGGPVVNRLPARAGVVKVATELDRISPVTEKLMAAAARCHQETGAPILTHTERGTMALAQISALADLGVEPSHVLVSHVDRNHDRGLHAELATTRAYLVYDGPSRAKYHTPDQVAELIGVAVDHGAGDRVLLGLDLALRSYRSGYGGSPGLGYLQETFLPVLARHGFDEAAIHAFGVANPARALALSSSSASLAGSAESSRSTT